MRKNINAAKLAFALCICGMLSTPVFVQAAESKAEDTTNQWNTTLSIYLWAAGINGSTQRGADLDIGFDDIISELDFAVMGTIETRKGKWLMMGDVVYLDVKADKSATLTNLPVDVKADLKLKGLAITLLGGYNLSKSRLSSSDFVFGMRYFNVDTSITSTVNNNRTRGQSVDEDVYDAVIGLQGQLGLSESWFMPYYFDIGTGDSDSTMQLQAGFGYRYDWGDLQLIYRYLEWNLDSDSLLSDINFNGPIFGGSFYF